MDFSKLDFDLGDYIALISLVISLFAFILSRKSAKLKSYSQKGAYRIFLLRRKRRRSFDVKIFNSVYSETLPFNYELVVHSDIGGIYRSIIFHILDVENPIGTYKTLPSIHSIKPLFLPFKKYAYNSNLRYKSTPLHPYFTARTLENNFEQRELTLSRYHLYFEITDYCNNTELWYMSFSLFLSNKKDEKYKWKRCKKNYYDYKYYVFNDINIVSPRDLIRNYDQIKDYNKTLKEIEIKYRNTTDSKALDKDWYNEINWELEVFEMKEYNEFLKNLREDKIIN